MFSQDMSKCFESQRYHRHNKNFSYDNSVHYSSPSIILWERMTKQTSLFSYLVEVEISNSKFLLVLEGQVLVKGLNRSSCNIGFTYFCPKSS